MSRVPEHQLLLAATLAAEKARGFFQLDPKWDIKLEVGQPSGGSTGEAQINPEYYGAYILLSEDLEDLEMAWATAAHEIAHVALAHWNEYADMAGVDEHDGGTFPAAFRIPLEKTTMLLEKLFLAAHPFESTEEVEE